MNSQWQVLMLFGLYVALLGCDEGNDQTEEQFLSPDAGVAVMTDAGSEPEQSGGCAFGSDCAEGLACVKERGTASGHQPASVR